MGPRFDEDEDDPLVDLHKLWSDQSSDSLDLELFRSITSFIPNRLGCKTVDDSPTSARLKARDSAYDRGVTLTELKSNCQDEDELASKKRKYRDFDLEDVDGSLADDEKVRSNIYFVSLTHHLHSYYSRIQKMTLCPTHTTIIECTMLQYLKPQSSTLGQPRGLGSARPLYEIDSALAVLHELPS